MRLTIIRLPNQYRRERPYVKAGKLIHYGNLPAELRRSRYLRNEENMPFPALMDTNVTLISLDEALASEMP